MATIQQLERALIKADAAGDAKAARAFAAEIKRMRAAGGAKPKAPAPKATDEGFLSALGAGALRTPVNVFSAGYRGVANLLDLAGQPDLAAKVRQEGEASRNRAMAQIEPRTQARPITAGIGELGSNLMITAPVIGAAGAGIARGGQAAATVAPRAGQVVQRIGQAVQTGGLGAGRTAAQTAQLSKAARAAQLAQRVAGGAIAGGAGAGLVGQDIETGAAFGAGLPVVASVVRRLGGKVADLTKMPRLKAAQIIRQSLEGNIDKARAAFAALPANDKRLAEQVLIDAGVEPRTFFGLGKTAEEQIIPTPFAATRETQAAAREARLAGAAGGATATEQRAAIEGARKGVNVETGPLREAALERANIAGEVVPPAERIATLARQRADEITASGLVPRMRGLEERATEQARLMGDMPAIFPEMEGIQQTRGIAGAAGQRAEQAMGAQIGLRQTARDMEDIVADLAAEGMQPLKVAPIVAEIRRMANAPATRISTLQRRALTKAANQLDAAQDANGVIDARDLYQFRKSELGDIINVLMSARNQPPSGVKEAAAGKMADVRKIIDDAIENAGGAGFKDYLTRTRQGFEAVNRQELAAKGAQLAKESPDELIKLMGGERPQMVEDIMGKGTGQYDIGGLALADPRRYLAMQQSAKELATLNRMAELRGQGAGAAANLMIKERPSLLTRGLAAATLSTIPSLRIGAQGAEQVERSLMTPRVQKQLANAFLSGQDALSLMNQYPSSLVASEALSKLSPGMRNAIAQIARQYTTGNE